MKVDIIASGSSGNCAVIDDSIVIDAGVIDPGRGESLLLTHEHGDHTKYLSTFGGCQMFTSSEVAERLRKKYVGKLAGYVSFTEINKSIIIGTEAANYLVQTVDLKHDVPCVGFDIKRNDDYRILWLTDFNEIIPYHTIVKRLRTKVYNALYIECNNTMNVADLSEVYFGDTSRDDFHRIKSFQNHCNVGYLTELFRAAGYSKTNRCNIPLTLLHKSTYYYNANVERLVGLCEIVNVTNPFL